MKGLSGHDLHEISVLHVTQVLMIIKQCNWQLLHAPATCTLLCSTLFCKTGTVTQNFFRPCILTFSHLNKSFVEWTHYVMTAKPKMCKFSPQTYVLYNNLDWHIWWLIKSAYKLWRENEKSWWSVMRQCETAALCIVFHSSEHSAVWGCGWFSSTSQSIAAGRVQSATSREAVKHKIWQLNI